MSTELDRLVNKLYEHADVFTRQNFRDVLVDFLAPKGPKVNDMQLIDNLKAKVAKLESEVAKLVSALKLEKDRSTEWKKQAMRLAEEKGNAVDHPGERKQNPVEGTS
jgi:hypothetical protein